jgi:cytochrome c553
MKTLARLAMTLAACALSSGAVRAADVSPEFQRAARQLAETTCANCHGVSGRSISAKFPILAVQTAPHLQTQLHAFRDQTRGDPDALTYMWGMASQLSDATIEALFTYYAAQAPSRAKTGDAELMARGKQIFEEVVTFAGYSGVRELPRPAGTRQRYFSAARRAARRLSGKAGAGYSELFARRAGYA